MQETWKYAQTSRRTCFDTNCYLQTKGRVAFLLRCRGPCRESLEPTSLEMFPGEILTLYHDKDFSLTMDGKPLIAGDRTIITQPASINVAPGDTLLLIVIFTKC
jgi:hypothetical protein